MRIRIFYFLVFIFFIFVFVIFYRGLNNSNLYTPNTDIKSIPEFTSETLIKKKSLNSKDIFNQKQFYLLNIWASWCAPCKTEHKYLMSLSKENNIKIIGLNYKDTSKNAKIFLNKLNNPYDLILSDQDGIVSIEWGAYGVPESFLIYKNNIIKKIIGPIDQKKLIEIKELIK